MAHRSDSATAEAASDSAVKPAVVNRSTQARRASPGLYIAFVVFAIVATFAYKLRIEGVFACPASYTGGNYLSDCQAEGYGDYDHGALWFGLEPRAQTSLTQADVLFVGNSRVQLAFSGDATARWFADLPARHFLLGFSFTENVTFTQPLLWKLRPRAKVYVINVDRFFDDRQTPPTEAILRGGDVRARYREKQVWQALHASVCARIAMLCGEQLATYRSRSTGAWQQSGRRPDKREPVSDGKPGNVERWARFVELARSFVSMLPLEERCVLLTIVPSTDTRRAEATAIAEALGLELISPRVEGMRTFDGSHLEAASAERWSAAFLAAAGPRIRQCLKN